MSSLQRAQEFLCGQLKASVGRKGAQNVCDLMAASVRFFAFNFFIIRRTWTLAVLSHIPSSYAMTLFDLPCWIARTTASSRAVSAPDAGAASDGRFSRQVLVSRQSIGT